MKLYAVISPLCILFSQGIMPAQAQQLAGGKIGSPDKLGGLSI